MSEAFHSSFTALFVETPETKELKGDNLKRLRDNLRLAEQLGAQIATVYGEDAAVQIAEYAKVSGITKIVLGRTNHHSSLFPKSKTLVDKLTKMAGDIDIYIIPDTQPLFKKKRILFQTEKHKFSWFDLLKVCFITVAATLIGFGFYLTGLREANFITVYILGVLLTAIWTQGHLYGALASLLSVISFNFFFTVPRFTLAATDPDYPVTFFIMLMASIISSTLATQVKKQARQSAQKAYYMELLMDSNQKLQQGRDEQEIMELAAKQISALLDLPILYALVTKDQALCFQVFPSANMEEQLNAMSVEEKGVADWVVKIIKEPVQLQIRCPMHKICIFPLGEYKELWE